MIDLELQKIIQDLGIPVVQSHIPVDDPNAFVSWVRDLKDKEGFIIAWSNGYRVKIKTEEYVRIHKTKDNLNHEKNVVDLIVNEKMDDVKPFMLEEDRKRVDEFETDFWIGIADTVRKYEDYFASMQTIGMDRKTWALEHMPTIQRQNPFTPAIVFGLFDGRDARKLILDIIAKHTSTQTRIDSVRLLWGNAVWHYQFNS